jgi:hypothetical protein
MTDTTTPPKGQRITGTDRANLRDRAAGLYVQGCTIASVARQTGRSYGATRALLLEAGVQLRARGGGIRKAAS